MQVQELGDSVREAYQFDSFEVSVRTRMLRQGGERLKIQELPFQMLLVLLETPGETVSKEQLGKRLWGEDTFVEVDKSLYVIAGKLREALGDDAAQPRFIRTVSGRGYRFVGELVALPEASLVLPSDNGELRAWVGHAGTGWRRVAAWTGAGVVLLAAAGLFFYRYDHRVLASGQDKIVFGGFANGTGNPELDQTLSSAVQLKLQESPYLSLIPESKFRAIVKNADAAPLKDELSACESLGGQVLLRGGIRAKANGYQVLLTAWSCTNHHALSNQTADAGSQGSILSALDVTIDSMRRRLGEPESSLHRFNIPLEQATTASLTALKSFTLGEQKRSVGDDEGAVSDYKLAIDLDPQFALAYARIGTITNNSSRRAESQEYYRKAFELKNRASDREKLYIVTHYYEYVTGEITRAIDDYEVWRTLYPRDVVPANNLALEYLAIGQPARALPLARAAVQLDPSNETTYFTLGFAYLRSGDYAALIKLCKDPVHEKTTSMGFHRLCYRASFAVGDEVGMQQQMKWASGRPEESEVLNDAAWVAMYRGQVGEAHRLFGRAVQSSTREGSIESTAGSMLDEANLDADFGYLPTAGKEVQQLLSLPFESARELAGAASVLARTGDIKSAQADEKRAASMAPLDSIVNAAELASERSSIEMQQHDPAAAVQSLEEARPWDLCGEMELAPAYYRGLAYLRDEKPREAALAFQEVIDHSALADFPAYVALSQLQQGRAYMATGDKAKAAVLFAGLERLWSHADQGFPPLALLRSYEVGAETHGSGQKLSNLRSERRLVPTN